MFHTNYYQPINNWAYWLQPYSSHTQSNGMCWRCVSVQLSLPVFLTCKMFDMCLCPLSLCSALLLVSVKTESPEQGLFTLFFGSYTENHHLSSFICFVFYMTQPRLWCCWDVCDNFNQVSVLILNWRCWKHLDLAESGTRWHCVAVIG